MRIYDRRRHEPDRSERTWAEPRGQSFVYTGSGRLYDANGSLSLSGRADLAGGGVNLLRRMQRGVQTRAAVLKGDPVYKKKAKI